MSRPGAAMLAMKTTHVCHYCRVPLEPGVNLTVDHIVPRCSGGTNHSYNLVACCVPCNIAKGTAHWHKGVCRRCDKAWRAWQRKREVAA